MPLSRRSAFSSAYADGMETAQGTNGNDGVVGELAAVREARQQLSRREEVAVRRGRQAGLSWAEIGTLLGVTKQTMHRKYRKVG
jgi:DNA-directed RNA polymerase specialized sigma24 family protein